MTKRVLLWSAPRCVSTAFERSIMEIENSKTFHEPYTSVYYFGPERQSERYKNQDPDEKKTYKIIRESLLKDYNGIDLVFAKDMAYVMCNRVDHFLQDDARNFQHTFLIRNPKKSIPSYYAGSINKQLTGFEYFDPEECGFKELFEFYRFIVATIENNPVVVDADDLLEDPEGIMRAYCERIGVRFDKKMLEWEPRAVPSWELCKGWHVNVLKSSGFRRQDPNKSMIKEKRKVEGERLPDIVMQTIEKSMPFYEELYKKRIMPKGATENK